MSMPPELLALRRLALAVAVFDDIDIEPYGEGLVLRDGPPLEVAWSELRRALGTAEPDSELARLLARRYLRGRRIAASADLTALTRAVRPVGLPADHPIHPGPDWVSKRVLGGALDLGIGFVGVDGDDPDSVSVIPARCFRAVEIDPHGWWPAALEYLERMGAIAAQRLSRDRSGLLRPIGDCDAVTLLGSRQLRTALAQFDGSGMRAVAVPMRRRGWIDLRLIDPAFAPAAAAATDVEERGFCRPLLVTADEVTLAPEGRRVLDLIMRDPAAPNPAFPNVRPR
jgi:hypothetical protein